MLKRYLKARSGQGMSEYLILVLLIAVGSIAAAKTVGSTIYSKLDEIHDKLQEVHFGDVAGKKSGAAKGGGGSGSLSDALGGLMNNL